MIYQILKNKLLIFTALFTIALCASFALNLSPSLRGPTDPIFESHWPYYFINTISKIWVPLVIGAAYILFFFFLEKRAEIIRRKEIIILILLVFLAFLFQISLVFFSRFGITVLFRRITDSGINGYFTAAVSIHNVSSFLADYPKLLVTSLPQHSRGDPPGPVLFMYLILNLFKSAPTLTSFLYHFIRVPVTDAQSLWNSLVIYQRVSAVFLGFFLHFLSALSIVPFYFLLKKITNIKVALRGAFIWGIIPSLVFFSLIFDPIYTIFPLLTFLTIAVGYKKNDLRYFLISGLLFSIGLFFTLSILPLVLFMFLLLIFSKDIAKINVVLSFMLGVLIIPSILLIFGYNTIVSGLVLISSQAPRTYLLWLFYNPYDVFVYMGIPISLLFIYSIKEFKLFAHKEKVLLASYLVTFIALVVSGISRGEVGRIWIPLMIFPVGFVSYYLTNFLKYKRVQFAIILALLILECIILEEFWVPIW